MPKGVVASGGMSGGMLPSNAKQTTMQRGNTEYDSVPTSLYYVKAMQEGNPEEAMKALNHTVQMHGAQTGIELQFLGKRLRQANINDIAKSRVNIETNPELKKLYAMVNENPDIVNKFEYFMKPNAGISTSLAGR